MAHENDEETNIGGGDYFDTPQEKELAKLRDETKSKMDMDIEELKRNMEGFVGKKVKVIAKDHPHYGEYGVTKRVEMAAGKPGMVVQNDDGDEFFVFDGTELFFIIAQIKV